jgi:alkaline phosphatase D
MPALARGPAGRRVHRRLRFGDVLDLILLDVRQYREDQPCDDEVRPPCAELGEPPALLGRGQMAWPKAALSGSGAAWKAVGNVVTMMGRRTGGGEYLGYDAWQGYPREREELLSHIALRRIRDVVFLSGDQHVFSAGDVRLEDKGPSVAPEFACGSVTSAGPGENGVRLGGDRVAPGDDAAPATDPAVVEALRAHNPWVDRMDLDHHGYGVVTVTPDRFDVAFRRVATIKQPSASLLPENGFRWRLPRNQRSLARLGA